MNVVTVAFDAASRGRFDELESMVSPDIDWRGLAGEDGEVPRCHGRTRALELMRRGQLARREVSVRELDEHGDRVLAHVHRVEGQGDGRPGDWFVVAEVQDGQITQLRGYAAEAAARVALHGDAE